MDPSAGSMGDPWDHPTLLASIDDLCNNHFRTSRRSVAPVHLIPGPTQPSTATNPITQSVSPATVGTTSQATIEGARLPGNQKQEL
jgi:hypothetical protein